MIRPDPATSPDDRRAALNPCLRPRQIAHRIKVRADRADNFVCRRAGGSSNEYSHGAIATAASPKTSSKQ
jgi:hypothetical protein